MSMSKFFNNALWFTVGGIFFYSISLISIGVMLSSIPRTIALIVSVIVVVALSGAFLWFVIKTIRFGNGWKSALWTFLLFAGDYLVTASVLDWGPGANIRDIPIFSFLPEGNLLIAAGRAGWIYFFLFVMLAVALFLRKEKTDSPSSKSKPSKTTLLPNSQVSEGNDAIIQVVGRST